VATATTCAAVRHDLQATISELSLCHGTVGNADVLLSASEALPDRDDGPGRLARQAGEAVLDGPTLRHDPAIELGPDWIPGLMQGLAGVGLFLLRLHDISIPSSLDIFTHR
jgi:lantibiotic modifying enzyme